MRVPKVYLTFTFSHTFFTKEQCRDNLESSLSNFDFFFFFFLSYLIAKFSLSTSVKVKTTADKVKETKPRGQDSAAQRDRNQEGLWILK